MTCDPNNLSQLSSCLRCLSDVQLLQTKTLLLCRWLNAVGGVTPPTPPVPPDPALTDWVARVVVNGGAVPSANTQTAVDTFIKGLKTDLIWTKMLALNIFAPDNLTACLTPLIVGTGSDPWVNHGFIAGNLSVNGLQYVNGSNNYLDTGCNISVIFSATTDCGFSWGAASTSGMGFRSNAFDGANMAGLYTDGTTIYTGLFQAWDATQALISGTPSKLFGSASRAAGAVTVYQKNTANGNSSVGGAGGAGLPNLKLFAYCWNSSGAPATFSASGDISCSILAIHKALDATQTTALYNRFQTLRTSLGGGSV
jgi:hypothetical protein